MPEDGKPSKIGYPLGVKVEVGPSSIPDSGNGLFAKEPLKKGTVVTWYEGTAMSCPRANRECHSPSFLATINHDTVIDGNRVPTPGQGAAQFANHSYKPNAEFVRYQNPAGKEFLVLKTKRDVAPGEELFINYGRDYWARKDIEPNEH